MNHLRNETKISHNTPEIIEKSYDCQAGTAIEKINNEPIFKEYKNGLVSVLSGIIFDKPRTKTVTELGCGDGIMIKDLALKHPDLQFIGIDLSEERIKAAEEYCKNIDNIGFIKGNESNICSDITYTVHCLEPNGGSEEYLLKSIINNTSEYVILIEPSYELGNDKTKNNILTHKYIMNLEKAVKNTKMKFTHGFLGIGKDTNQNALTVIKVEK